jgi:hypothetical protein
MSPTWSTRRTGLRFIVLAPLLAACADGAPTSLLLTVVNRAAERPEAMEVRVFDSDGAVHRDSALMTPAPAADGRLGTVLIFPRRGGDLALRIHALGLRQDAVVSEGTAKSLLMAGHQTEAVLTLFAAPRADGDADGVPDDIDSCPKVANAAQERVPGGQGCHGDGADARMPREEMDAAPDGRPNGAPCFTGPDCLSGSCVEGICCDRKDCRGNCRSCRLPGAEGSCQPLPDPHPSCR